MQSFDVQQLDQQIAQHPSLITTQDQRFTTAAALEQEIETALRWLKGQGKATPFRSNPDLEGAKLNPGQAEAISRTLLSTDRHQIIHGLSGVGKTRALGGLAQQLEEIGTTVRGFSPTIDAAAELQKALGIQTNTVEHLVLSRPEPISNQLWIIDEAGMISARQMQAIGRKADAVGARILLVGDKGQNSSVAAGSPLRSLINHGATTHSIRWIIRQQNLIQRQAVELVASGNGSSALELLHAHGYIIELGSRKERAQVIAEQYLALSSKERHQTLIVTGTNAERLNITQAIRSGLKTEGTLGDAVQVVQLVSRQFTAEQSRRIKNYQVGDYIKLHRNYHSTLLQKGQLYKVEECRGDELLVSSYGGRLHRFNPSQYKDKQIFRAQAIELAIGDSLRWTATDREKGQINGQRFTVSSIEGTSMTVVDGKGKTQDVPLLQPLAVDYNLVSTSYRAQSKSQKRVIVSATSDPTSAREPFYVKISRQTTELSVYTQDLKQLRKWVTRSNAQENPLDLLGETYEPRPITRGVDPGRYPGTVNPDGTADQRYRQQMQPDSIDYSGSVERLHRAINRAAIAETLGGLGGLTEGLNRINQQLHQGATNRRYLAREIGRLSEPVGSPDQSVSRTAEQRIIEAFQHEQISGAIGESLSGLKQSLNQATTIKPVINEQLVELVETLQQTVSQIEERAAQAIREEKLNRLAQAITQWKADFAITQDQRLQTIAEGVIGLRADQVSAEVLRTQDVVESLNQLRAEDYIHAALHEFQQAVSQGMKSLREGTEPLNSTLTELRSLLAHQVEVAVPSRQLSHDAHSTPRPKKVEVFWQPAYLQEPPPTIDPKHWQQLQDSAIHPDLIELNTESISGYQVYERLLSEKLARMGSGQFVTAEMAREMRKYEQIAEGGWWGKAGIDALSLGHLKPGETPALSTWGCYKPDNPRIDHYKSRSKGKTEVRKYENPAETGRVPFLPQVPDWLAEKIYQKHRVNPTDAERQSGFWFVVKQYPQIPITLTEGFKKTLASLSQGEVTIGLTGTNHIYRARDEAGNLLPQRQLNQEISVFTQPGREFRFAYDQDNKPNTVRNVRRDMVRGIELLEARGCTCKVIKWNREAGKGLDDLITNQGPKAYSIVQQNALAADREKHTHYRTEYNIIARQVGRELGDICPERLDLEVYIRAVQKGEDADGARFVGESDLVRSLRKSSHRKAQQYVQAIASVAGTYKRLSERHVENLDELITKALQRQAIALDIEDERTMTLRDVHSNRTRIGPGL